MSTQLCNSRETQNDYRLAPCLPLLALLGSAHLCAAWNAQGGRGRFGGGEKPTEAHQFVILCLARQTGELLFQQTAREEVPHEGHRQNDGSFASPVGANGRVYLVGRNGVALVIKHSDKLEVLATNRLDEKFDASPAVVGKELFLRGREYLYCIAEK